MWLCCKQPDLPVEFNNPARLTSPLACNLIQGVHCEHDKEYRRSRIIAVAVLHTADDKR